MADIYRLISIIGFSLSGLFLLLSIFLFVFFKITRVIGDLSGRTAAKQIEQFRQSNAASGAKSFRPDPANVKRGKLTEQVADNYAADSKLSAVAHPSKRLDRKGATGKTGGTANIETAVANALTKETDVLADSTTALSEDGITESLSESTTVLDETVDNGTEVLSDEILNATTVLSSDDATDNKSPKFVGKELNSKKSVVVVHTDEVIE